MNMQMSGIWICSAYVIFSLFPVQIRFLVVTDLPLPPHSAISRQHNM